MSAKSINKVHPWFCGDVAVHMWKTDDPEGKVISIVLSYQTSYHSFRKHENYWWQLSSSSDVEDSLQQFIELLFKFGMW